jgi:urease accessory protein
MLMAIEPARPSRDAGGVSGALFAWFSPAFPTGGFAYSHGLETAAAEGLIEGEQGLGDWLEDILVSGAGWSDAVLMNLAYEAGLAMDAGAVAKVLALSAALSPSRERLAETLGQGEAFLAAVRGGWPDCARTPGLPSRVSYPVAAGCCAAGLGAPVRLALSAYLTGFATNLLAAGVRLSFCGQIGGVRILSRLGPVIADLVARGALAGEDDLGGCALFSDIASARHETLGGRLFLS